MRSSMSNKKPVWATTEAHARLKEYCTVTGKTQLEVVSELIMTHLDPENPEKKPEKDEKKPKDKHLGGVWVV
jgi:hypothetical protein